VTAGARRRGPRAIALAAVIAAGLGSRSGSNWVPDLLAIHAGDALYATAVYLALGLLTPRRSQTTLLVAALALCLLVEASQAIEHPVLDWLRGLPGGRLVLGHGFDPADPWRYLVGTLAATALDGILPWARLPSRTETD
jgi:hypothetical protein